MILALDTTSDFGSIALVEDGLVVGETPMHSTDGFGHVLFGQLQAFLEQHGVALRRIDCFAAASGPGSFTGVRVGLAAIKGLAESMGRPVVGVSNLRAIAYFGSAPLRAVTIDARRGEVYAALYDDRLEFVGEERVLLFEAWAAGLPPGCEFSPRDFAAPRSLAGAIGQIAWREFTAGRATDPAALDANYVRRSDAELSLKKS